MQELQLQQQPPRDILSPFDTSNAYKTNDFNNHDLLNNFENKNSITDNSVENLAPLSNTNQSSKSNLSSNEIQNPTNVITSKPPAPLIGIKPTKQNPAIASLSGAQINTLEARKIAAQRFVEFHKRQSISKTRLQMHPSQQNLHKKKSDSPSIAQTASVGNISNITMTQQQQHQQQQQQLPNANEKLPRPKIHYSTSIYQKPRPEMVQPRLPSISYKTLKRP